MESAFAEVFLTTRITQVENKMLDEIRTWLQTENQTATIRKQETVRRTIRMAYEYMQILIAQNDNKIVTFPTQPKQTPTETPQIVETNKNKPYKAFDPETYKSFEIRQTASFKTTPQNVGNENDESLDDTQI